MRLLEISKVTGAVICLLLTIPYIVTYKYFFHYETLYRQWLFGIFFFGVLLHFLAKIPPGEYIGLAFFGKRINKIWSDGYCLIPSLFPVLHKIDIYLLWSLILDNSGYRYDRDVNVYHYQDQRSFQFRVNSNTSLLHATMVKFIGNMASWFFEVSKGDPKLLYQRVGFRMMLVSVVLGLFANLGDWVTSSVQLPSISQSDRGAIAVTVQLKKRGPVTFPNKERFVPVEKNNTLYFFEIDGTKYLPYAVENFEDKTVIKVENQLCGLVPVGKKVVYISPTPPRYAINMKEEVLYVKNIDKESFIERNYELVRFAWSKITGGTYDIQKSTSWENLYSNWSNLGAEKYGIEVTAELKRDVPSSAIGGLVCF